MEKLIFDRTENDIINKNKKSRYNYIDFNRVESWCQYISEILNFYSYPVNIITKTNYSRSNFPDELDLERIRQNVNILKQAYFSFTEIPENLDYMTWQKANDIERILYEIDKILKHMENNFIYAGVGNVGSNRIWQQRFRRKYIQVIFVLWEDLKQIYWNEIDENSTWEEIGKYENNEL